MIYPKKSLPGSSATAAELSRRAFVIGAAAAAAGCVGSQRMASVPSGPVVGAFNPSYQGMYGPVQDDGNYIPAVDLARIDPQYYRQMVSAPAYLPAKPGTIVVDPERKFLYLIQSRGDAIRYGIGVGREGFGWNGTATIKDKQHWPKWHPPKEMMERDPEAAKWPEGMPGGIRNPLGARALYLWQGNKDTLYRLHGTNQPSSIGRAVSSGCIRLLNQDVIDLYERTPLGTEVVVLGSRGPAIG